MLKRKDKLWIIPLLLIFTSACSLVLVTPEPEAMDTNPTEHGGSANIEGRVESMPASSEMEIFGKVIDSEGLPVDGVKIAIFQQNSELRVDPPSTEEDGSFREKLPASINPNWNVQIVGLSCTSRVRTNPDPNCNSPGMDYFEAIHNVVVTTPLSEPVTLMYEKATATISGKVSPAGSWRLFAIRSDGARSWGDALDSGEFTLPASDGTWEVYVRAIKDSEVYFGEIVIVEVNNGESSFVNVTAPVLPD